eukprot:TRINITY_DN13299_c0_g1_i1.p1 TRINITY_DN13299_c0_g1~~TRINITY_DN13299_c0_g1_i1.p1  ORF type:complete len:289 (+),score=53.65 TRINITY_DN13299_c0_g1_i1:60-926(+)
MGNTYPQTQKSAPFVLDKKIPIPKHPPTNATSAGSQPRNTAPVSVPSSFKPVSDAAQSIADSIANDSGFDNMSPTMQQSPPSTIPTVFKWRGGGKEVSLISDVDGWQTRIPLSKSGVEFHTILEVLPGTHYYRFVVDGVIRSAPEQPTGTAPVDGGIANVLDVTAISLDAQLRDAALSTGGGSPPGTYSRNVPSVDEYRKAKEPPMLPPHLHRALLNSPPPTSDSNTLPVPAHVVLNHLYSASRTDAVMLLGVTHRYRAKFVTTVFYTPCNQPGTAAAAGPLASVARS